MNKSLSFAVPIMKTGSYLHHVSNIGICHFAQLSKITSPLLVLSHDMREFKAVSIVGTISIVGK